MNNRIVWPAAGVLGLAVLAVGIASLPGQRDQPFAPPAFSPPTGRFAVAHATAARVVILDTATGQVYAVDGADFRKTSELPKVGEDLHPPGRDRDWDKEGRPPRIRPTKDKDAREEKDKIPRVTHTEKKGDSWESISKRYYGSERYAEALKAFNGRQSDGKDEVRADEVFIASLVALLNRHGDLVRDLDRQYERNRRDKNKDKFSRRGDKEVHEGRAHRLTHYVKMGDTWESISKRYYESDRYAEALKAFNGQSHPGKEVRSDIAFIPLLWVLLEAHGDRVRKDRD